MLPFKVESGSTPMLHAELPSFASDERACIAVGSSNSQTNSNNTNDLAIAISKLATAVESIAASKSSKQIRDKALSAEIDEK